MTLAEPARSEFDRVPPQAIEAEQSVLGAMMLSKDAIADAIEVLGNGSDFYRPAHGLIFEAVLDLYSRGEPADAVTVAAELTRTGQLSRVGGAPYLHTLIALVPTAANAAYYAEIVRERGILRRLVEAGRRIEQMGYESASGSGEPIHDVDQVVDRAQAEVYAITERRAQEDYVQIESILQSTLDEIERIAGNGIGTGIPTGFAELDEMTNGLQGGQMIVIAGRPGSGKALALDTPLPTPTGWTTMGDVQVGDYLLGADGFPTRVVAATEVMHDRPCYEVEFSDGSVVTADAQHQWRTTTRAQRRRIRSPLRWSMSAECRMRAALLEVAVNAEPDRHVSIQEFVGEIGADFEPTVKKAAHGVGSIGREPRTYLRSGRPYQWHAPVYSRQALAAAVTERVATPTSGLAEPSQATVTTEEIARTLRLPGGDGRLNHAIDCAAPLQLDEADLLIPPYTLGAWLGDGSSNAAALTCADQQIVDRVRAEGIVVRPVAGNLRYRLQLPQQRDRAPRACEVCGKPFVPALPQVRTCGQSCGGKVRFLSAPVPVPTCVECGSPTTGNTYCQTCWSSRATLQARLRSIGVIGNKHIPVAYLRASERQRRDLLAGLLDTDGYATAQGSVEFSVTNERLARDVYELVVSLGYRASIRTKPVNGRTSDSSIAYTVAFTAADRVFGLDRKAQRQRGEMRPGTRSRYVVDVRPVPSVPVRCVQVDNENHLYLAGRAMIPTHNSTLAMDFARAASIKARQPTVLFSLEMGRTEIMMRLFSAESGVPLQHMRSGNMSDQDWVRLARRTSELAEAPLFIDDSPNLTMMEIRSKARRLAQRQDLKMIVIDYLQLMTSGKRVESRQQEVSEFSRAVKLLAKELDVPVVVLSQLNRGPEQRTDKKPMLSDLRESGSIEQDSDLVMLVHREDMYDKESVRAGEADIIVAKHRNGRTGTIAVSFQGHLSRFTDMAT